MGSPRKSVFEIFISFSLNAVLLLEAVSQMDPASLQNQILPARVKPPFDEVVAVRVGTDRVVAEPLGGRVVVDHPDHTLRRQ